MTPKQMEVYDGLVAAHEQAYPSSDKAKVWGTVYLPNIKYNGSERSLAGVLGALQKAGLYEKEEGGDGADGLFGYVLLEQRLPAAVAPPAEFRVVVDIACTNDSGQDAQGVMDETRESVEECKEEFYNWLAYERAGMIVQDVPQRRKEIEWETIWKEVNGAIVGTYLHDWDAGKMGGGPVFSYDVTVTIRAK